MAVTDGMRRYMTGAGRGETPHGRKERVYGSMRNKIYWNMVVLSVVTILLTSIIILMVSYHVYVGQIQAGVKNEAIQIENGYRQAREPMEYLNSLATVGERMWFTVIARVGKVEYDSGADVVLLENHADRPEVIEALEKGYSEDRRLSETFGKETYYFAVLMDNGKVLRISNTTDSLAGLYAQMMPVLVLLSVLVLLFALLLAAKMTKKLVEPLNNLDLNSSVPTAEYEEITPLMRRLSDQNRQIHEQIALLRRKQEEFAAIMENMSEGLVVLDNHLNILSVNKSAVRLLKARPGDYQDKNLLVLSRNLRIKESVEYALLGRHTDEIWEEEELQVLTSPVKDEGRVKGAVLLVLDVSERLKAERSRKEFSANVSHELKTPLTSISGFAEMMEQGMVRSSDMKVFAGKIHAEALHLIKLVQDIIELSKLDEGITNYEKEHVDLKKTAQTVVHRLALQAKERKITVSVEGDSAMVYGIPQMLGELLYNLVENAIKYNKDGGSVTIRTAPEKGAAVLSVSDTGIGIPKDSQERVFERFYRVDKSHSKKISGTGLGLSIVKHVAEYHKAKIELVSQPGQGTCITVRFPCLAT